MSKVRILFGQYLLLLKIFIVTCHFAVELAWFYHVHDVVTCTDSFDLLTKV